MTFSIEGEGITLAVYLLKGFAGRSTDLHLKDVCLAGHPHHHIDTTAGTFGFAELCRDSAIIKQAWMALAAPAP